MEENENISEELNSNTSISFFLVEMIMTSSTSSLSFNPLFSCIVTFYTLILLYFPHALELSLSPVLILTLTLLLILLRFGAIERVELSSTDSHETTEIKQSKDPYLDETENSCSLTHVEKWVNSQSVEAGQFDPAPNPYVEGSFVEWNVRAPLDVIYEAYEGEEEERGEDQNGKESGQDPTRLGVLERYSSLAMFYPETDSDSSSDCGIPLAGEWDLPERFCSKWEEEDREGLLIEIALDREKKDSGLGFQVEEDNLIEIDISP